MTEIQGTRLVTALMRFAQTAKAGDTMQAYRQLVTDCEEIQMLQPPPLDEHYKAFIPEVLSLD